MLSVLGLVLVPGAAALAEARLDLEPLHISEMFLPAEIERMLNAAIDPADPVALEIEEIEVERERYREPAVPMPDIWPGIGAPFWAMLNPADGWRILLPWLPGQAAAFNRAPDLTRTGLPPAAWTGGTWPYE